jgi:hypothetical protein
MKELMNASEFNHEQAVAYLSALIDGEGSVTKTGGRSSLCVQIANTEPSIIRAAETCLSKLAMPFTTHSHKNPPDKPHWKPHWIVFVHGRENLIRLGELLVLQSEAKQARMQAIIDLGWSRVRKPPLEELVELYHGQQMALSVIADHYSVSRQTIRNWIRSYAITPKTRAEALRQAWARGDRQLAGALAGRTRAR